MSHNVLGVLKRGSLPASEPHKKKKKKSSFLYALINPNSEQWQAKLFKKFISLVIVLDLIAFVLDTDPSLHNEYHDVFHQMEIFSSCLFGLEYLARLAVCAEKPKFRQQGPIKGRLAFMMTTPALMDALATLPWFLEPLLDFLPELTFLRFLRILRITKTNVAMRATDSVYRVIKYNSEILYVAAFVCILLVMGTGVALYYLRPPDDGRHGQGLDEQFNSILATMYLSTLMLTGQGGPDLQGEELPWYTKLVVLMTSIVSVAMFAIPGAMFTWGFEAEAERMAKRAHSLRVRRQQSGNGEDLSDDDYSTDEEYQKIIAGEDDEPEEEQLPKELLEKFAEVDQDGSGHISLKEFVALSTKSTTNLGGESPVVAGMMCRIQQLERDVKTNSDKLDKILELLGESKKKK